MLRTFFEKEKIEYYGVIPFGECRCIREDLIGRKGVCIEDIRSAIVFLVPYYADSEKGNVSLYARSGDYHFYCDALFERLLPVLRERFGGGFIGFADKSPISETEAAARAGLGVLGDNGLLINETYGSFVFIGEILSTVAPEALGCTESVFAVRECLHCGACRRACPARTHEEECLSALTQKKGVLTPRQENYIRQYGMVWGCDICQSVCPMTQRAIASGVHTPIDFFWENRMPSLTEAALNGMTKEEFRFRAFSWRGKQTLLRNLALLRHENNH